MHSWWIAPLGNIRVLLVCFARIAFSSLETWPVTELKVASGKPKRKHCSKRISQEQEEKENRKSPDHSNKCRNIIDKAKRKLSLISG